MMEGLIGFPEASIDIWGGYACHCSKCRKERGEK